MTNLFLTSYEHIKETLERLYFIKIKLNLSPLKTTFTQELKLELVLFTNQKTPHFHFSLVFIFFYDLSCMIRSQWFPPCICNRNWLEWQNFLVQVGVYDSPQSNQKHVWCSEALGFSSHLGFQAFEGYLLAPSWYVNSDFLKLTLLSPRMVLVLIRMLSSIKASAFRGQRFDIILVE